MNLLALRISLVCFIGLLVTGTVAPVASQASTITFAYSVDVPNGNPGSDAPYAPAAIDAAGISNINAGLNLVDPYTYATTPVPASLGAPQASINIPTPTVSFAYSVSGSIDGLAGNVPYGNVTSNNAAGVLNIDARLNLVDPFKYDKTPVTASFFNSGASDVSISTSTPNSARVEHYPLLGDYGVGCVTEICGLELQFVVTHVDNSNAIIYDLVVASLIPLSFLDNDDIYAVYFVSKLINTSTGVTGSIGATFFRNEAPSNVPVPGAVWLMGTVLAGGFSFAVGRRRRTMPHKA
jgi:hypothetical protein